MEFAASKHRDQRRKDQGASPYINPPVTLAYILVTEGGVMDPVAIADALLHDTVEDADTTYEELVAQGRAQGAAGAACAPHESGRQAG